MKEFTLVFLWVVIATGTLSIATCNQKMRALDAARADLVKTQGELRRIDSRLHALEEASIYDIYDLNLIGVRTTCLRQTLETLISTWPGRAKLPEPCGSWPAWPRPGDSLEEWKP